MTKTAAQRQAAYRARRPYAGPDGNGERRLNLWLSTAAALALRRLARHHQLTQRAVLERLLDAADQEVLDGLDSRLPAWDVYFGIEALRSNASAGDADPAGQGGDNGSAS